MEQLSIFDMPVNAAPAEANKTIAKPDTKVSKKSKKPELPAELTAIKDASSVKDVLDAFGFDGFHICMHDTPYIKFLSNTEMVMYIGRQPGQSYAECMQRDSNKTASVSLIYVDSELNMWGATCKIEADDDNAFEYFCHRSYRSQYFTYHTSELSAWKLLPKKILEPDKVCFLQDEKTLEALVQNANTYAYNFLQSKEWCKQDLYKKYIMAPQMEQLSKAGYVFADNYFNSYIRWSPKYIGILNRLTKPESMIKTIFKTPKSIYSLLQHEPNLEYWDAYRKLEKFGKLDISVLQDLYTDHYSQDDIDAIARILHYEYNGKPVFTFQTLNTYLHRLDTYEAIPRATALQLIPDYLMTCNALGMKPKTDSDSLRREHDVAARILSQKRNELMAESLRAGMEKAHQENSKYDYKEQIYSVRAIKDYADLQAEAQQQHNCVACYANNIVDGRSLIFVMRTVAEPEKSLITIELDPTTLRVRQKLLAFNQPIHNKSQSDFISRWEKHVRTIKQNQKIIAA